MGDIKIKVASTPESSRKFMNVLLKDIHVLEEMIEQGLIESDKHRIGAEQELCLIDQHFHPAPLADEVLAKIEDSRFTNELSRFNIEINLDPIRLGPDSLSEMETQLKGCLNLLGQTLKEFSADYILVGILPTIRRRDLDISNMTPRERYYALNDALTKMRGRPYEVHITGIDELITTNDSVMFESCNTSFQFHYQVSAEKFTSLYNWAQLITGPVLSMCTNSPMFLGKRLWRETRIALFHQATDPRGNYEHIREVYPRVFLGDHWIKKGIVDIYRENISTQRPLMVTSEIEDPLKTLKSGRIPKLKALGLHNGTIYKWNRACYGITENKPHLRIENRYLPSGPSVIDEMANGAFWVGLMHGMPDQYKRVHQSFDFDLVKLNLVKAARLGMGAKFDWVDGKVYPAQDLILNKLMPISREGLKKAKIKDQDIDRYLQIIEERLNTGKSGSQWMVDGFDLLKKKNSNFNIMTALTAGMAKRQKKNRPVHQWGHFELQKNVKILDTIWTVDQIMTRKLFTVGEEDLLELGPYLMKWNKIRHVLVEKSNGELAGLLTLGKLARFYYEHSKKKRVDTPVKDIMQKDVITINHKALTKDAIALMEKHQIGSLPVLNDEKKLVGIITERDLIQVASKLIENSGDQLSAKE